MTNIEIIERLKTAIFTDEEDEVYTLEFQPGLSDDELAELDAQFPTGKLPAELREILKVTKGWEDAYMLETTFFDSIDEFGFDELIPHSVVLGHDGLGNYWVLEITNDGRCGKVFYACHDPAVLVIFCDTLNEFLKIAEEYYYSKPDENYLDEVHDKVVMDIWNSNPNLHEIADFRQNNPALSSRLSQFDDNWVVADLRTAEKKGGFAWGRQGSNANTQRLAPDLLWVLQKKKKGFLSKLFG